jgi:hypothetical protein
VGTNSDNARNSHWNQFLGNAKEKDVFKAYKYTKSQRIEKLPVIIANGQKAVTFEEKCNIFLKTLFSESPTAPESINWDNYRASRKWKWKPVTNAEIKEAIFSSAIKKAPGPNGL